MRTKSEARRQAIIDTARAVFSEQGFAETSMSEIAAKLGGSKATLYNYFSSKEELFVEIIRQFAEAHLHDVFAQLDARAPLRPTLDHFGVGIITVLCTPDVIATRANLFLERDKSNIGRLFYERGPLQALTNLSNYCQECTKLGHLRSENSFIMAQHLMALLKSEGEELIFCGIRDSFTTDEIRTMAEHAIDVFLRAYSA
jgi:AcrR family transcriptional regulator